MLRTTTTVILAIATLAVFSSSTAQVCEYTSNCVDDMYIHRLVYYHIGEECTTSVTEHTEAVRDGAGYSCGNPMWFMVSMESTRVRKCPDIIGTSFKPFGLIMEYDAHTCDMTGTIQFPGPSGDHLPEYYALAHDSTSGTFWVSTWTPYQMPPRGKIVHLGPDGSALAAFSMGEALITGLAIDNEHRHLWGIIGGRGGSDRLMEWDISGGELADLQGPIDVPWPSGEGAAGLEYCEPSDAIVAVNANSGSQVWFIDLDPGYSGSATAIQPGIEFFDECTLSTPAAWGIALARNPMSVFVAGTPPERPYPLDHYHQEWGPSSTEPASWGRIKALFELPAVIPEE